LSRASALRSRLRRGGLTGRRAVALANPAGSDAFLVRRRSYRLAPVRFASAFDGVRGCAAVISAGR
jgi:hypothetical protein